MRKSGYDQQATRSFGQSPPDLTKQYSWESTRLVRWFSDDIDETETQDDGDVARDCNGDDC